MAERILTGIKPTGQLTLGNYIGAIKQFIKYQDDYNLWVFIADLHALTLPISQKELIENTENLAAIYIAAGLDPKKVTLFKQSDIIGHTELSWVLTCNTVLGDKKWLQAKNILNLYLNSYPRPKVFLSGQ